MGESKESACNVGDLGSNLGLGRSPGGGNGDPLDYSCLENLMDREAWQATVQSVAKSRICLSVCTHVHACTHTHTHTYTVGISKLFYLSIKVVGRLI